MEKKNPKNTHNKSATANEQKPKVFEFKFSFKG